VPGHSLNSYSQHPLPSLMPARKKTRPANQHVMGPRDRFSFTQLWEGKKTEENIGHLFIDDFSLERRKLEVRGWAYVPGSKLKALVMPGRWESKVEKIKLGTERGDIQSRFGGQSDEALHSGFHVLIDLPRLTYGFSFTLEFSDGFEIEVRPKRRLRAQLRKRFWKNLGHTYLFWLKPLKKKIKPSVGLLPQTQFEKDKALSPSSCISHAPPVDIVLPVYNGLEYLQRLLPKLLVDPLVARLIIIDDCSPDAETSNYLSELSDRYVQIELIRNEKNLGFVASVNRGFERVRRDCILLNSDVDVPDAWVERLMAPIFRFSQVATTTPFTNAGTILSFPEPLIDNAVFANRDVNEIDQYFRELRTPSPDELHLPTGVGFCMGMSRQALQNVGDFDEQSFGRGYAEENDWCQRAIAKGYFHVPVANLYVHHEHGGSFDPKEREDLIRKNLDSLAKMYPHYHQQVQEFIKADPLGNYRKLAMILLLAQELSSETELIFDHTEGGGANYFREREVEEALQKGRLPVLITPLQNSLAYKLEFFHEQFQTVLEVSDKREMVRVLSLLPVKKIHLNSVVFHPRPRLILKELTRLLLNEAEVRMIFYLHDYHAVCPSHNLLDDNSKFCGVPTDHQRCRECLAVNPHIDNHIKDIDEWRGLWMVVGVFGNIGPAKGAEVLSRIAQETGVRLVVIGKVSGSLDQYPGVTVHGNYRTSDMPALVAKYKINVGFIPSIWAETYSFVTDELMAMGLPVLSFDIGAHAERIAMYPKGKLIPLEAAETPAKIENALRELHKNSVNELAH